MDQPLKKQKEKPKIINKNKNFFLNYWAILTIIILLIYSTIRDNYNVYTLRKNGKIAKGIIYDIKKVGSKGDFKCSYSFIFNNIEYKGAVSDYYNKNKLYDSIEIIFTPSNPNFNRSKKYVDEFKF